MPKLKKSPIFKYGIEITKPFSKAMYAHNDGVATEMRDNILKVWNDNIYKMKEFFDKAPKMRHKLEYVNKEGNDRVINLEGISDFF